MIAPPRMLEPIIPDVYGNMYGTTFLDPTQYVGNGVSVAAPAPVPVIVPNPFPQTTPATNAQPTNNPPQTQVAIDPEPDPADDDKIDLDGNTLILIGGAALALIILLGGNK